jgi:hypothetical protein
MKRRNIQYMLKQKALRNRFRLDDITRFLLAGFHSSQSLVVKKDILNVLFQLKHPQLQPIRIQS